MQEIKQTNKKITKTTAYLTKRPHFVRVKGCVSDPVLSSLGAPQGTVDWTLIISLHSIHFQSCHLYMYSDDCCCEECQWWTGDRVQTTGKPLSGVVWEQSPHLDILDQAKRMTVDFWRTWNNRSTSSTLGEVVTC